MADRTSLLAALRELSGGSYNWYLGTPEQLIEAGVLEPHMLERRFPACNEISALDDFGISTTIKKRKDGRLRVIKAIGYDRDRRAAKTIEKAVGAQVSELLAKFKRTS